MSCIVVKRDLKSERRSTAAAPHHIAIDIIYYCVDGTHIFDKFLVYKYCAFFSLSTTILSYPLAYYTLIRRLRHMSSIYTYISLYRRRRDPVFFCIKFFWVYIYIHGNRKREKPAACFFLVFKTLKLIFLRKAFRNIIFIKMKST